ncbi:MAG TPA: hypothetical protein VND99_02225 [Candidatus Acidoferrales bacterium]|nr:hypothetical protein [Candidatus Acidoferrales bacterium]
MDQVKVVEKKDVEEDFSFKKFFVPFTTFKAIHLIILIGLAVYFNVFFNGFVWDDWTLIIANPQLYTFNIFHLFGPEIFKNGGFYRPIPAVYFSLLWNLFGNMAFFYHLIQIILHIASALLFFFFLKRYFSVIFSFFLVLIFLIHPIQVESVAYIGTTQSELLFLFGLSALLISIRDKLQWKSLLLMTLFLNLSLLTNETGFLFLILIVVYQFFYNRKRVIFVLPYLVITVIFYAFIRLDFAKVYLLKQNVTPIGMLPMHERFMTIPAIFFYYLKTFFYPAQLSIYQSWTVTSFSLQQFYLPLLMDCLFILSVVLLGVHIYKKNRKYIGLYLFFFIWYFIGIALVFQIYPLDMTVADRWFYFPMAGMLGMIGTGLQMVQIKKKLFKKIVLFVAVLWILALSIRTIIRNFDWVDQNTLFFHDAKYSVELEDNIGNMYFQQHNFQEAKIHYQKSLAVWACSDAYNNLGLIDQSEGNLQKAQSEYLKAVQCNGEYKEYGNLIILLYKTHQYDLAEKYTKIAIQKFPNGAGLYFILGAIEDKKGNKLDSLKDLNKGYQMSHDPQIAKAIDLLKNNKPVELPL